MLQRLVPRGMPLRSSFLVVAFCPLVAHGAGDGTFLAPFKLLLQSPTAVAAADFNRDGKLDLAAVTGALTVFLQDSRSRFVWARQPASGGGYYHVHAADFDGDQADDLVTADPGAGARFLRSRGDGTFDPPLALKSTAGARWTAAGDFDGDGNLDLAIAL